MSGFHTATICATCEPPVVAISTGYGSRCPRCGHVDDGERPLSADLSDGALARRILVDTAVRSDGDAWMLRELSRRLLDLAGEVGERPRSSAGDAEPLACPHCAAGEPSVWDDVLSHYAHPDGDRVGKLKVCHTPWRERSRAEGQKP